MVPGLCSVTGLNRQKAFSRVGTVSWFFEKTTTTTTTTTKTNKKKNNRSRP